MLSRPIHRWYESSPGIGDGGRTLCAASHTGPDFIAGTHYPECVTCFNCRRLELDRWLQEQGATVILATSSHDFEAVLGASMRRPWKPVARQALGLAEGG